MKKFRIAIDGPSASGKSTISKLVAKKLNFQYLDTGSMYRALTLYVINNNINLELNDYNFLKNIKLNFVNDKIHLNNEDVSEKIRDNLVTSKVSYVASKFEIREYLVNIQKEISKSGFIILDGRDIGSNVIKDAELKIYLTASIDERARRRFLDNQERNIESNLEDLKKDLEKRDYNDSNRKYSPLIKADDAILIDSTNLERDEVVNIIINLVNERMQRK